MSTERPLNNLEQVPVREIQIGKVFKPFEGVTVFPSVELDQIDRINFLARPIKLLGIKGRISLLTDPTAEDLDNTQTPLGKVRFIRTFDGNGYAIDEVPLGMELNFDITTMEEFQRLDKLVMEFELGGSKYCLRCGGVDDPGSVKRSISEEGSMTLFDCNLNPSDGENRAVVLLPYDINKIAAIEAQVVEKETPIR